MELFCTGKKSGNTLAGICKSVVSTRSTNNFVDNVQNSRKMKCDFLLEEYITDNLTVELH